MHNFWLIVRHEYRKMTGTRSFKATTAGVPILILVIIGIGVLAGLMGRNTQPIGYVDHAGILAPDVAPPANDNLLEIIAFPDAAAAEIALAQGEIQAFYVIPADFPQDRQIALYYWEDSPGGNAMRTLNAYLRANLVAGMSAEVQTRLIEGADVAVRSVDGSRELSSANAANIFLPFVAAFLFIFAVISSAGYLIQVVADEKENRTMEIMITSISPLELIGGKALGLMAVSLTQIGIWVLTVVVAVVVGANYIEFLQTITIPWSLLLVVILYFLPAYALVAGLMTAIGGAVTEVTQGQQIGGILNLLFLFPLFLAVLFFSDPNSPIVVAMTLFPTTSFLTVTMRWGLTSIPLWQLVLSWLILTGTAVFTVWAAARIFRAGMLHYGQPLSLKATLAALSRSA